MTVEEFVELRKRLGLTQTTLAEHLGMSLRAVQAIENRSTELRKIHVLAIERVSLAIGSQVNDPTMVPANVTSDARSLASFGG